MNEFTKSAIQIAMDAGNLLKKGFHSSYKISNKEGVQNLVTEFDLKSEDFIISSFKKLYPNSGFICEERGEIDKESSFKWIIDPLDGTVNFAHKVPFFCVNIALQLEGEINSCVTYNPMNQELFYAEKGIGAFLNGSTLKVSKTDEISQSFLATGFPYDLKNDPLLTIKRMANFLKMGVPIRRLGSAALDLAYVAAGRFDGYWEINLGPWDVAAGLLLVQEAGGKITDLSKRSFKLKAQNEILASNNLIHEKMVEILNR